MRRMWLTGACALGCGPVVGVPGESADGGASESTTAVDSGLEVTTVSPTAPGGTTAPGTTSPSTTGATSVGETSGSEGADESTGAEPPVCGRDSTPIGKGTIEWESVDLAMKPWVAVAFVANGLTVVGEPANDEGASAIRRFDVAGNEIWSLLWWDSGVNTQSSPRDVMALPNGLSVAHVYVHSYVDGSDWSMLVAVDEAAQVVWETPVHMDGGDKHGHADVTPSGSIVLVHRFDEQPYGLHVAEVDGDGVLVAESFTETPWLNPYDVAAGPSGEILASGEVDIDDALDIGYIARWLPTQELDLWLETPDLTYATVEALSNGNIVAGSQAPGPLPNELMGRLHIFDVDGVELYAMDLPFRAFDLEVDCMDRIVVGGEHGAMVVDGDGSILWASDFESGAWSVAVDDAADVFGVGASWIENDDFAVELRRLSGS